MRKIIWSESALGDLRRIEAWLGRERSPEYAVRILAAIRFRCKFLKDFPHRRSVGVLKSSPLDEQDHKQVSLRIDPGLRAERSAVSISARRHHPGHALGFFHNCPTVAKAHPINESRFDVAGLRARHFGN